MALQGITPCSLLGRVIHLEWSLTRTREVQLDKRIIAKTNLLIARSQDRPTGLGDCHTMNGGSTVGGKPTPSSRMTITPISPTPGAFPSTKPATTLTLEQPSSSVGRRKVARGRC